MFPKEIQILIPDKKPRIQNFQLAQMTNFIGLEP
jgi:hypothetical protein